MRAGRGTDAAEKIVPLANPMAIEGTIEGGKAIAQQAAPTVN